MTLICLMFILHSGQVYRLLPCGHSRGYIIIMIFMKFGQNINLDVLDKFEIGAFWDRSGLLGQMLETNFVCSLEAIFF